MWQDFRSFLVKQNALALAIAVVIGTALDKVVKAIVDGLIMPIVAAASPDPAHWERITFSLGPVVLRPGLVLGALINFLIVGVVAWRLSRALVEPAGEPSPTRSCPFCRMNDLDAAAVKCRHCASELQAAGV